MFALNSDVASKGVTNVRGHITDMYRDKQIFFWVEDFLKSAKNINHSKSAKAISDINLWYINEPWIWLSR